MCYIRQFQFQFSVLLSMQLQFQFTGLLPFSCGINTVHPLIAGNAQSRLSVTRDLTQVESHLAVGRRNLRFCAM